MTGIDVLFNLLDDLTADRREIYRIRNWLRRTELPRSSQLKVSASTWSALQLRVSLPIHTVMAMSVGKDAVAL